MFCSICWETYEDLSTLRPCQHKFCASCLMKQLQRDARCAICRQHIFACYPNLISPNENLYTIKMNENIIKQPLGIMLKDKHDQTFVSNTTNRKGRFKKGDHIVSVNCLPIYNRKCLIQILQSENTEPFVCYIKRKRNAFVFKVFNSIPSFVSLFTVVVT